MNDAKIISITILLFLTFGLHAMDETEKSLIEKLPGDVQRLVIAHVIGDSLITSTNFIKSLAGTNKFWHEFINRDDTIIFIMKALADKLDCVNELDAEPQLKSLPGLQNLLSSNGLPKEKLKYSMSWIYAEPSTTERFQKL